MDGLRVLCCVMSKKIFDVLPCPQYFCRDNTMINSGKSNYHVIIPHWMMIWLLKTVTSRDSIENEMGEQRNFFCEMTHTPVRNSFLKRDDFWDK